MGSLTGLKILDLSRLLPGPYCTLLLADLGADVVKVEDPESGGDYLRHMPPLHGDVNAIFLALNRNKRSIALDLRKPADADVFKKLLATYDIVVESFRPGVMDKMGLGYAQLAAVNPKVIMLSLSGYGQTGPLAKRAGHDLNYLSRTGVIGLGGDPSALPAFPGVQIADIGGALLGATALLAAVVERDRTGKGRHLDVALADAGIAFLQPHLGARLLMGDASPPLQRGRELLNGGTPVYGLYKTKDGRALSVGALEPKFWMGFCQAIDRPDLEARAYATGEDAVPVRAAVAEVVASKTLAEWEAFLADKDLCIEPVREGDEVLSDAFFTARGLTRSANGATELLSPLKLGDVRSLPAPKLGEHTAEVLRELGITPS
ncbi:MAG: CoA transferase [Deltaproteobacteria bacterium]|nr:CoA transferase [Deltaproteobacteria bacterium]